MPEVFRDQVREGEKLEAKPRSKGRGFCYARRMTEKKKAPAKAEAAETKNSVSPAEVTPKPQTVNVQERLGLPTEPYAVVGNWDRDTVQLSSIKLKNIYMKKSLSVRHLQRRLAELGYLDAASDKEGWMGDLTFKSLNEWRADSDLPEGGDVTFEELEAIFKDDPNVLLADI